MQDKGGVRSREGSQAAREEGGGRGTAGAGAAGTPGDLWRQWTLQAPKLGDGLLLRDGSLAGLRAESRGLQKAGVEGSR